MKKLICVTLVCFLFTLTPAISNAAVASPKAQQQTESTKHLKKSARHEKKHKAKKAKKRAGKKKTSAAPAKTL